MSVKTRKHTVAEKTPSAPRRRITLIEVLVVVMVGAVLLRFLYYVVHWRDLVATLKPIEDVQPIEWAIAVLFVVGYYLLNRRNARS
jgi:hypothetical protein